MLSKKNNSYVLKLYDQGTFQTEDKIERLYFVVDYSEKRDLYQYVKASNGFGERYGKLMFKKIIEGIHFVTNQIYIIWT